MTGQRSHSQQRAQELQLQKPHSQLQYNTDPSELTMGSPHVKGSIKDIVGSVTGKPSENINIPLPISQHLYNHSIASLRTHKLTTSESFDIWKKKSLFHPILNFSF